VVEPRTSDRKSLSRLAQLVTRRLGIRMPPNKLAMLESRLQKRMTALGLTSLKEYAARIEHAHGAEELKHFFDVVTTNKTDFFREPQHFKYLYQKALPALAKAQHGHWHCRVWCAGCSSGEEVYTLAMVLAEYQRADRNFEFSIVASDISTRVLALAQSATYAEAAAEPIPLPLRSRYLLRSRSQHQPRVRIVPDLRKHVQFMRLNFMDERYPLEGRFDVIFFRNVMIYFDKPTQQSVLDKQLSWLRPGGYLFVSLTESLAGLQLPLESVESSVFRKTS
jgi:chemotaxis protein methyltransferase CheR